MKIMTVVGTRPELIRLSDIIPKLDKYCDHVFVHTGQNYDPTLKDIFFKDLHIREPDYSGECSGETQFESIGKILKTTENIILKEKPDKFLILGDTNSCLSAIVAKRMGIKVYHMEAGNRCYNDKVPEEVNRRIIDHSSDILLPYTESSRQNLIGEGFPQNRIFVTGNPIWEIIKKHLDISTTDILNILNVKYDKYFLVTCHRAENMNFKFLSRFIRNLQDINKIYNMPVIISMHPRTRIMLRDCGIILGGLEILDPMGFNDFLHLEANAFCVISDSGTVQEECCLFKTPNVTIRETTERPETIECGSNIICGCYNHEDLIKSVKVATDMEVTWNIPKDYLNPTSDIVTKILLGDYP
jgi:UDP-N-acetylglucosamine 2-epimerase (non-hydrolysing)